MKIRLNAIIAICFSASLPQAVAQTVQSVVDIPTRPDITQRLLVLTPPAAKAAVVMFAGGNGAVQISPNGSIKRDGNFLVRTRQLFADQGLVVAILDVPSDRQRAPYLAGFRQTPEHAADVKAVIAWLRGKTKLPVWLIGTSRGTQSVGYVATELAGDGGPDGIVLTSTILLDPRGRPVPAMPLEKIRIPVLVVHHEQDECRVTPFGEVQTLMAKLGNSPRKELLTFKGGQSTGDLCEAFAYHGYNGVEAEVVQKIAAWVIAK